MKKNINANLEISKASCPTKTSGKGNPEEQKKQAQRKRQKFKIY